MRDPGQFALQHGGGGPGTDAEEQIAGPDEILLGRTDVAPLSEQPAAVSEQLGLPERVSLAAQRPQRTLRAGERPGGVSRVPQHADPEYLRSCLLVRVQRAPRNPEFSQGSLDRPSVGEVRGKPAAGECRPARKAVALADPDRQADVAERAGVAQLVAREAQGMKRRYLGFRLLSGPRELECSLSESGRGPGVDLDQRERGLGQRQRVLARVEDFVSGHVSKGWQSRSICP